MRLLPLAVVFGHALLAVGLGWVYFRRYRMTRPPMGVFNLWDVALIVACIVLVPYLHMAAPDWLVIALLGGGFLGLLYYTFEPVLKARWAVWLVCLGLMAADAGLRFGASSTVFFVVNNALLLGVIVGTANLWAQGGLRARDAAVLGALLGVYDFLATSVFTQMTTVVGRLDGLPFAPMVAWPVGDGGQWWGIGLGDLLFAAVFPLAMRKAFGVAAGLVAAALAVTAIAGLLLACELAAVQAAFPVMVLLGPLMVLQYLAWRHRRGPERTTWQYLQAEPI